MTRPAPHPAGTISMIPPDLLALIHEWRELDAMREKPAGLVRAVEQRYVRLSIAIARALTAEVEF